MLVLWCGGSTRAFLLELPTARELTFPSMSEDSPAHSCQDQVQDTSIEIDTKSATQNSQTAQITISPLPDPFIASVGGVFDWEAAIISAFPDDLGKACFRISADYQQTTLERARKWLRMGVQANTNGSDQARGLLSSLSLVDERVGVIKLSEYRTLVRYSDDVGRVGYDISIGQQTMTRAKKWLELGAEVNTAGSVKVRGLLRALSLIQEVVGDIDMSEYHSLVFAFPEIDHACFHLSLRQANIERARRWLQFAVKAHVTGTEGGSDRAGALLATLSLADDKIGDVQVDELKIIANGKMGLAATFVDVALFQESMERTELWLNLSMSVAKAGKEKKTVEKLRGALIYSVQEVGDVSRSEFNALVHGLGKVDLGAACAWVSEASSTLSRAKQWLRAGIEANTPGSLHSKYVAAGLLYATESHLVYKRDEAVYTAKHIKWNNPHLDILYGISDSYNDQCMHRFLVQTLLCGDLEKNGNSPLHRSFFKATNKEVLVLPLLVKYLTTTATEEGNEATRKRKYNGGYVSSSAQCCHLMFAPLSARETVLELSLNVTGRITGPVFLTLRACLLSRLPNVSSIVLGTERPGEIPNVVDLSFLRNTSPTTITRFELRNCVATSLSVLSKLHLSTLILNNIFGLTSLAEVVKKETFSISELVVQFCHDFQDISTLSDCDLTSLKRLWLRACPALHDISPLSTAHGFAPHSLDFSHSGVSDISPLSRMDLSAHSNGISLRKTMISDLSALEKVSKEGLVVHVFESAWYKENADQLCGEREFFIGQVQIEP